MNTTSAGQRLQSSAVDRLTLAVASIAVVLVVVGVTVAAVVGRCEPSIDVSSPGGVTLALS